MIKDSYSFFGNMQKKQQKEQDLILLLKKEVENALMWSDSKFWRHRDFILLFERIKDKTGKKLASQRLNEYGVPLIMKAVLAITH
ncbi:MAG: hypothetical protein ACOC4J_02015 [Bacteroidota bacterium]